MNTFVDVISENAERHPNKTALVDESGSYTYQELARLSNGVAVKLIGQGIGAGDIVPILMTRSKAFVAAFIGVMKSGAAFVPLDINYPEERIKSIEESVEARIFIDDEWMKDVAPSDEFINNSKPEDMAFIIFTSGSTGKPKGVVHTHSSAIAMSMSAIDNYPISNNIIYTSTYANYFIAGISDYLTYLSHCHTIYVLSDKNRKDINSIIFLVKKYKINAMGVTPSFGMLLLNQSAVALDYLEFIGEQVMPISNKGNIKILINKYGCSEFIPASVNHTIKLNKPVPIGNPTKFTTPFIILEDNTLAHKGETGELCLVGPQMASGYWKMPELTAEKFVHCPFLPGDVKMYKTGDLARYREDGNIELVGRKDFQIKIRGFRIEPGEIENVAVKFDGIDTVVVVAKEMGNEKQLVLYYTSGTQIDETKLKEYLAKYLADYMVPNFYVHLDEMPRNTNGKIDRSALPEPKITGGGGKSDKPATELEKIIFYAVAKQIGNERFGVDDCFDKLGLTSLSTFSFVADLNKSGYNIRVDDLNRYPSIRSLASNIDVLSSAYRDRETLDDEYSKKSSIETSSTKRKNLKGAIDYLSLIIKITRMHPKAIWQFLRYNSLKEIVCGNVLLPSPHCVFHIEKSAIIRKRGINVIGHSNLYPSSKQETRLSVYKNAQLDLCYNSIVTGASIAVRENGHLSIGAYCGINWFSTIECLNKITIGERVAIGCSVFIRDSNGVGHSLDLPFLQDSSPVTIGDGSWLCEGCKILSGVTIGQRAIVGTGAVVYKNVPKHAIAFGNPAEIVAEDISFTL